MDSEESGLYARPDGSGVCEEYYRPALSRVCVAPELMAASAIRDAIYSLRTSSGVGGPSTVALDAVLINLVRAAFPAEAPTDVLAARRLCADTHVDGGAGELFSGG